jgi:hypothetical protein
LENNAAAAVMLEISGNTGQCKSEHLDFKKAKESVDRASLRKETLKNRKEARF